MKRDFIDTVLVTIIFVAIIALVGILLLSLQGCTTVNHDPICKCSCKENNSSFECRTNYEAHSVDLN